MTDRLNIATWNLENFDDVPGKQPTLATRIAVMRPQLVRLNADVLVLQEVNAQEEPGRPRTLRALRELLRTTPYEGWATVSTTTAAGAPYDQRNLVVVSRFPILGVEQRKNAAVRPAYRKVTATPRPSQAEPVEWERPILYVKLDVGGARVLHLVDLHLRSRLPSDIDEQNKGSTWRSSSTWAEGYFLSSMKRVGQALEARMLVDAIFDEEPGAWIAVCGDFNAGSDEVPVVAIRGPVEETGNPALTGRVLVPCENTIPDSSRYSLLHLGKREMLDHLLVSRPLLAFYRGAEIQNEALPDESGAFRTDAMFPESDHAPVLGRFEVSA